MYGISRIHWSTTNLWIHATSRECAVKMQHTILFSDTIWLKYVLTFAGGFLCHCVFTRFCIENSLDLRISVRLSKQLETERHQFESRSGFALLFCLVSEHLDNTYNCTHVLLIIFSYHLIIIEGKELGIYHWNSSTSENGVALAFGQSWRERSTYQMPHNSISFLGPQKVISLSFARLYIFVWLLYQKNRKPIN